jgi:UDP-N-acetylmuramate dehydrogenase
MTKLREFVETINRKTGFSGAIRWGEPMAAHTSFKVGGPAEVWIQPGAEAFPGYAAALLRAADEAAVPVFILGRGSNLVVADAGIPGIVLDTGAWVGVETEHRPGAEPMLAVRSGTGIAEALEAAASRGAGSLAFLAGMPASIGGAVYMNARCYGRSIADALIEVDALDESFQRITAPCRAEEFGYKKSPFQDRRGLILAARFRFDPRPEPELRREMAANTRDREAKGQFRFPSAGSVFKNNRAFGKPTGRIIDELGLKGLRRGGAMVAPWHGNMIINTGNAASADIQGLVEDVAARVRAALGITLEPEIRFAP